MPLPPRAVSPGRRLRSRLSTLARDHAPFALLFALLFLCSGLLFVMQWQTMNRTIAAQTLSRAREEADRYAAHASADIALTDALLKAVRQQYEAEGAGAAERFVVDGKIAGQLIAYFSLTRPDGMAYLLGEHGHPLVDLRDRAHFRVHQGSRLDTLYIGAPIFGRASHRTVIPFSRGLHRPDGRLGGMVMAGMEPRIFSRDYDRERLGAHGTLLLLGTDGVARSLSGAAATAWPAGPVALAALLQNGEQGQFTVATRDGGSRAYAWRKLPDAPLVAVAGIERSDVAARFDDQRRVGALALSGFMALLATILFILIRKRRVELQVRRNNVLLSQALEKIEHQARHDALTDLPNRRLLQDTLARAIARAEHEQQPLALMFIDLDRFKNINDSLGHTVGDALLRVVATRLQALVRRQDTIARLGGDEFVVVVAGFCELEDVIGLGEAILDALREPVELEERTLRIAASVGVAVYPDNGDSVDTLMKAADSAMYQAKAAGRDRLRMFDAEMRRQEATRLTMEEDMRAALDADEFVLYYQTKVDLDSGAVVGAEALLRWDSPRYGLLPPAVFVPLAEESGLILSLGRYAFERVCQQLHAWRSGPLARLCIAVNVSAQQFLDDGYAYRVAAALRRFDIDPGRIELELTETTIMADPDKAITQLRLLRSQGISIAVDDFGTGYSSLSYLRRLPLDVLKLDRSFVRGIDLDRENAAIVRTVLELAHSLALTVVAEGVETTGEEQFLRQAGCDQVQGFRYGRPLPPVAFERALMQAHDSQPPEKRPQS